MPADRKELQPQETPQETKPAPKPEACDANAVPADPACGITGRDPEDREVAKKKAEEIREKMMDKTLADSYPASDPPSSIPDPGEDDSMAA